MKNSMKTNAIFMLAGLALVGLILFAVTKSSVPTGYGPEWKPVYDFIQNADKVETFASGSRDFFPFTDDQADPHQFVKEDGNDGPNFIQEVPKEKRADLIAYLKERPNGPDPGTLCFLPHHFVIATKGKERVVVSICYTCAGIDVSGKYHLHSGLNRGKLADANRIFGGDVFEKLGLKE